MARKKTAPDTDEKAAARKGARNASKTGASELQSARNGTDEPQGTPESEGRRPQIGYTLVCVALIIIVAAFGYLSTGSIS